MKKRFIALSTALMLTATSSLSISTNAEYDEEYRNSLVKIAMDSLNQEYEVFEHYQADQENKYYGFITEDNVYFLDPVYNEDCILKFTDENVIDEIREKILPDFNIRKYTGSNDEYELAQISESTGMTKDEAMAIVMEHSGILSITKDEYYVVQRYNPWWMEGLEINSNLTAEEISEKYLELTLEVSENSPYEGYTYRFDFSDIQLTSLTCQEEMAIFLEEEKNSHLKLNFDLYDTIKSLNSDEDIDSWRFISCFTPVGIIPQSKGFYEGKTSVYIAPITGDTNVDGDINISDVLTVSAHINNKDKYPMEEQSIINGDVHDMGNGLNSSDAFMIQQYVTGVIEAL